MKPRRKHFAIRRPVNDRNSDFVHMSEVVQEIADRIADRIAWRHLIDAVSLTTRTNPMISKAAPIPTPMPKPETFYAFVVNQRARDVQGNRLPIQSTVTVKARSCEEAERLILAQQKGDCPDDIWQRHLANEDIVVLVIGIVDPDWIETKPVMKQTTMHNPIGIAASLVCWGAVVFAAGLLIAYLYQHIIAWLNP